MKNADRFAVFRAVQDHMHATGECPTARFVAEQLNLHPQTVGRHMHALQNADGLPFPIPDGVWRNNSPEVNAKKGVRRDCEDVFTHFERQGCV